jgi:hypothetical protein
MPPIIAPLVSVEGVLNQALLLDDSRVAAELAGALATA